MPVPDFSPGEVLTAGMMDQIGLWKVRPTSVAGTGATITGNGTVTAGGGTSVSLNGVFSSTYKSYRIVIEDATLTTGSAQILSFKLRASGTDSSASYYYAGTSTNYNAGFANTADRGLNTTSWYGTIIAVDPTGTSIDVFNPNLTKKTSYITFRSDSRTDGFVGSIGGYHDVASAYDGFTLLTSGTNIGSISIRVYGYN